ncbi:hypothetical protein Rhe02_13180 [Rhizocola hellebori]|uniref:Methyltransferase FkbM domain-containing protein n=1 Tax=Rhizocola hellebori TaxID=1392758 RepID=A0A8J3VEE9_9ACTN|nr:FkbM family methyltransferase [Rhizocola hellebori]GIH03251.1 hypothetical protein Rhe02_13180 [Rhizocola hellebori]
MKPYTQLPPFYAQWGEDRWLAENLAIPAQGTFVDVGAGDGVHGSNSLYFENLGWSGLAVEADPRNAHALQKRRCAVRMCAVARSPGRQQFGLHTHKSWSGLTQRGPEVEVIAVDCFRLADLLGPLGLQTVDLLSIDVEGTELDVWDSIDHTTTTCRLIIIEFDDKRPDRARHQIHRHLGIGVYDLIHESAANLIFERKDRRWPRRVT